MQGYLPIKDVDPTIYELEEKKGDIELPAPQHQSPSASTVHDDGSVAGTLVLPMRKMAAVNAILLAICFFLVTGTCAIVHSKPEWEVISTWKVINSDQDIKAHRNGKNKTIAHLHEGDTCEVYGNINGIPNDEDIMSSIYGGTQLHVVSPFNGWMTAESSDNSNSNNDEENVVHMEYMGIANRQIGGFCPMSLFGAGQALDKEKRFHMAPWPIVVAQLLWNAIQVVHMFLLLGLNTKGLSGKSTIGTLAVRFLTAMSTISIPFSVYLTSPGGMIYSVLVLSSSVLALLSLEELKILLTDSEYAHDYYSGQQQQYSVELVAFLCNLGCSVYNYRIGPQLWNKMFIYIDSIMGWTTVEQICNFLRCSQWSPDCLVPWLYTLGIPGVRIPLFVPSAEGSTTGHVVFVFIWSWLPFLYTMYFLLMYAMSHKAPCGRIQQSLCIYAIFHFLILTDVVDYKYGRGYITNDFLNELCHWSERYVWRVALLLPVYQNLWRGKYKKSTSGVIVHYLLAIWAIVFIVYQLLMSDIYQIPQFWAGRRHHDMTTMFGWHTWKLGYLGALFLMWPLYAMSLLGWFPMVTVQLS